MPRFRVLLGQCTYKHGHKEPIKCDCLALYRTFISPWLLAKTIYPYRSIGTSLSSSIEKTFPCLYNCCLLYTAKNPQFSYEYTDREKASQLTTTGDACLCFFKDIVCIFFDSMRIFRRGNRPLRRETVLHFDLKIFDREMIYKYGQIFGAGWIIVPRHPHTLLD